jgi:hypothetical protein
MTYTNIIATLNLILELLQEVHGIGIYPHRACLASPEREGHESRLLAKRIECGAM